MNKNLLAIKDKLDLWVDKRNNISELLGARPDPLQVASKYKEEYICLICALFAYGNARQIVKFLSSLNFDLLNADEKQIKQNMHEKIYRFQNSQDIAQFFISLKRLKEKTSLEDVFLKAFREAKNDKIIASIHHFIKQIKSINPYSSKGYDFLIGNVNLSSPYKRYNMFLRWMVRKDSLDLGLWEKLPKSSLLAPLDTHTHKMALKFGLIKRKTYDLKACLELTDTFRIFDQNDPIKYDFALYRLGQERLEL